MSAPARAEGQFTGRHLLFIMLAFFAVVIAVNVAMASLAGSSWTGFVVKNSYIASQEFNAKVAAARAQDALGWKARLEVREGLASLAMTDARGRPVFARAARLVWRSPATDRLDRTVTLSPSGARMEGPVDVPDGQWVVEIEVDPQQGPTWRDTLRMYVAKGTGS